MIPERKRGLARRPPPPPRSLSSLPLFPPTNSSYTQHAALYSHRESPSPPSLTARAEPPLAADPLVAPLPLGPADGSPSRHRQDHQRAPREAGLGWLRRLWHWTSPPGWRRAPAPAPEEEQHRVRHPSLSPRRPPISLRRFLRSSYCLSEHLPPVTTASDLKPPFPPAASSSARSPSSAARRRTT